MVFQSGCTILQSHQQCWTIQFYISRAVCYFGMQRPPHICLCHRRTEEFLSSCNWGGTHTSCRAVGPECGQSHQVCSLLSRASPFSGTPGLRSITVQTKGLGSTLVAPDLDKSLRTRGREYANWPDPGPMSTANLPIPPSLLDWELGGLLITCWYQKHKRQYKTY